MSYLGVEFPRLGSFFFGNFGALTLRAPPDTTIVSYRLWRSVQLSRDYSWSYLEERGGQPPVPFDDCFWNAPCRSKGDIGDPFGLGNLVERQALAGTDSLRLALFCLGTGESESCPPGDRPAGFQLHGASIVLEDGRRPVFAGAPSGPLVGTTGPVEGIQPLTISATDQGGGVYQAFVEIDGTTVAAPVLDANGGRCQVPFRDKQPCKLAATGTIPVDTRPLADGAHTLRVLINDATSTNLTAWGPVQFTTNNHRCNPEPRVSTLRLQAGLRPERMRSRRARARRVRARLTTRHGRKVRVIGSLTGPQGKVAGAPVCVIVSHDAANGRTHTRELVTNPDGRFSFILGRGPSRRLTFVHRLREGAVVDSSRLRVRAPVRVRASRRALRNGQTVVLRGRLRGRPLPADGAQVVIEARRGKRWQPFGTTRTRKRGRYRFRYRFTRTRGVQIYALRARVPRQAGYPYARGASRPVRVRVVG